MFVHEPVCLRNGEGRQNSQTLWKSVFRGSWVCVPAHSKKFFFCFVSNYMHGFLSSHWSDLAMWLLLRKFSFSEFWEIYKENSQDRSVQHQILTWEQWSRKISTLESLEKTKKNWYRRDVVWRPRVFKCIKKDYSHRFWQTQEPWCTKLQGIELFWLCQKPDFWANRLSLFPNSAAAVNQDPHTQWPDICKYSLLSRDVFHLRLLLNVSIWQFLRLNQQQI